jgi:Domain of unknown function (DUF4265)
MECIKIDFSLDIEDGYPPINVERLNAKEFAPDQYEILNSPFFIKEIAYGDVVTATKTSEGRLKFTSCVKKSPFKAISVIILDEEMNSKLMDLFRGRNCVIEYGEFGQLKMVAIAIPETEDYQLIRDSLEAFECAGMISYAELVA